MKGRVGLLALCVLACGLAGAAAQDMSDMSDRLPFGERSGHAAPPSIGTEAYGSGCHYVEQWEDGSALAYCPEDGQVYEFDPDGDITTGKPSGWYPID